MEDNLAEHVIDKYSDVSEFLGKLVDQGGPEKDEYDRFIGIVNSLKPSQIDRFRYEISSALNKNTLMGHSFVKPYGYAGDFELIDQIYRFKISEDPKYKKWDLFFQGQPGATAVRNRKEYFMKYCSKLVNEKKESRVLILGSGPASDVFEFLTNGNSDKNITFDLVDFDQAAIDFSKERNKSFSDKVTYYRINALRYNSFKSYHLIWSAGLFDYFKDKHFSFLIRKYYNCLSEDGEMVISNFSTRNPSKKLMENVADWILNLRTESDLYRIASDAFIDKELVDIDKEPLGINLFLVIRKNF